jgi:acetyl-CoA carboxylase carboxyltransferase component
VPRFTVVLRKAYAAGFYAMCAPGFEPRATLALPTATIGTMSAEASANAVYANKIAAIEDPEERAAFLAARIAEQEADFTLLRMGGDLVVDAVVEPGRLRAELIRRLRAADGWQRPAAQRHHPVSPV